MDKRRKKRMRMVWIIITLLAVLSMVAFTVAPLIRSY